MESFNKSNPFPLPIQTCAEAQATNGKSISGRPLNRLNDCAETLAYVGMEFRRILRSSADPNVLSSMQRRLESLSAREQDVLLLILRGLNCKEIAAQLGIGIATAAKHRARVFDKLQTRTTIELLGQLIAAFRLDLPWSDTALSSSAAG